MKQSGLTLLELLIAMTVLMILGSVAMPLSKVSSTRMKELQFRQQLRTVRVAIDTFKQEWNRDGDTLLGPLCTKYKSTCREVTGLAGYPRSLNMLLGVSLQVEKEAARPEAIRRYLRRIPLDPLTGRSDWQLRCYQDPPTTMSWCGKDVYDVLTTSQDMALDGTRYREW